MTEQRKPISGGSEDSRKQLQVEVRVIPKEERQTAASAHFMKCPSMVAELLGNLRVKCDQGCDLSLPLRQLASHEEYGGMYVSPL